MKKNIEEIVVTLNSIVENSSKDLAASRYAQTTRYVDQYNSTVEHLHKNGDCEDILQISQTLSTTTQLKTVQAEAAALRDRLLKRTSSSPVQQTPSDPPDSGSAVSKQRKRLKKWPESIGPKLANHTGWIVFGMIVTGIFLGALLDPARYFLNERNILQGQITSLKQELSYYQQDTNLGDSVDGGLDLPTAWNVYQRDLRNRASIRTFEQFLNLAARERWPEAYSLLSNNWKSQFVDVDSLAFEYRMTHRHKFHHYIPTLITDDREEYEADFTYWDFYPELSYRDRLRKTQLGDVLDSSVLDSLTNDFMRVLGDCYDVTTMAQASLSDSIRAFASKQISVRDLVVRDEIIETIGKRLGLKPISARETAQGKIPSRPKRRSFNVILVKEEGQWKVDFYNSFMMEKI